MWILSLIKLTSKQFAIQLKYAELNMRLAPVCCQTPDQLRWAELALILKYPASARLPQDSTREDSQEADWYGFFIHHQ
jgi:hypothetical protein